MTTLAEHYESVQVIDNDGELEGYALVRITKADTPDVFPINSPRLLTPIRGSRSSTWADLKDL